MRPSAFALALLVACDGCAAPSVTREEALRLGSFEVVRGQPAHPGIVIGAPHGTADTNTDAIAERMARDIGVSAVIARGFTKKESGDLRINVNRPTEGANMPFNQEPRTERARYAWEEYRRLLLDTAAPGFTLYIEFHCNDNPKTHGAIEVATVGIGPEQAERLKRLYYRLRDGAIGGTTPRVELKIEPVDAIYMNAYGAKHHGSLTLSPRAMAIELPYRMTRLAMNGGPYEKVIAGFLKGVIAEKN